MDKEILNRVKPNRADNTRVTKEKGALPPYFLSSKNKKGKQWKKIKVSKQKLLKGCHQAQVSRIQILFSVPLPLHFETHFAGPAKSSINIRSTSPKAY